jgi:nicotinamide-nucleotide amidase
MDIELIVIGSELMLGEIADTNTQAIARMLREGGSFLQRATLVGDEPEQIAAAVREAAGRADAVITTGGLGPTVDDPTRAAVARAAGVELVFHDELWEAIRARFARLNRPVTENNRQQALLPAGAAALPNPFGTAPGFSLKIGRTLLCAVPGVPGEMKPMIRDHVLPLLVQRGGRREIIRMRTIHIVGLGESQIDDRIGRWEHSENPAVGLAAHAGMTDVRITGRGPDEAGAWELIAKAEKEIRSALEGYLLGTDADTIAGQVLRRLPPKASLATLERGTGGALCGALSRESSALFCGGLVLSGVLRPEEELSSALRSWRQERTATHAIGLSLQPAGNGFRSECILLVDDSEQREQRSQFATFEIAAEWAANTALIALWKALGESPSG